MKYLLHCVILVSVIGCSDQETTATAEKSKDSGENFYPVSYFFRQQVQEVDSLKLPTVKFSSINNRKDTAAISLEEFRLLANEFIETDITAPGIRKHYIESSFADQSVPNITLNYTTSNKDLPVKRIDVILDPSPVSEDKVKTVYIEKVEMIKDTLVTKKLYWKSDKNFQLITSKKVTDKPEIISQVKVAWDNSAEY